LFDINWFILEYIINFIGKGLQLLICLVKLLASIFLSLFIVFVILLFLSTISVNKDKYKSQFDSLSMKRLFCVIVVYFLCSA